MHIYFLIPHCLSNRPKHESRIVQEMKCFSREFLILHKIMKLLMKNKSFCNVNCNLHLARIQLVHEI